MGEKSGLEAEVEEMKLGLFSRLGVEGRLEQRWEISHRGRRRRAGIV